LRDPRVLIERQRAGFDVDQIAGFSRGRLAGASAGGSCLQVNANLAFGGDDFGYGIIGEIGAINLVSAILIAPVDDDADVVQGSLAAFLVLLHAVSMDGEQHLAAFGLGEGETRGT